MSNTKTIAKNTSFLMISSIISYILYIMATMYIAKYLGAQQYGVLAVAFSFNGILGIFTDIGLGMVTVRDVARDKNLKDKYISNTIVIKIILAILTLSTGIIISIGLGYNINIILAIILVSFAYIFSSFALVFFSIFQAYQKMKYQALIITLDNIFLILAVLAAIKLSLGVLTFAAIYGLRNGIVMLYMIFIYKNKYKLPKLKINLKFWKYIIKEAIPFGVVGNCISIYFLIPSVLLSVWIGQTAVGYYNVAYKLVFFFLSIYLVYMVAMFPVMSELFKKSQTALKFAFCRSIKYTLVISIPLAAAIAIMSQKIIFQFYGASFSPAIQVLQILTWTMIFLFLNSVFVNLLGSINRQMTVLIITAVGLTVNICLNILLIPIFGYVGASVATVITEMILCPIFIYTLTKIDFLYKDLLKDLPKILISTSIMVIFILYLNKFDLIWLCIIGIITYAGSLHLTNTFDDEDKYLFKKIMKTKMLKKISILNS